MEPVVDILIVGGGPAGSAAAIEARRAGLSVVLVDKATFPRDKCCGDGLTAGALRHLEELGLNPNTIPSWKVIDRVCLAGPDHKLIPFSLPASGGQFAAVARRSELDSSLLGLAKAAGVQVHERCPIQAISMGSNRVKVTAGGQAFRSSVVIAADGIWSPTRKLLGLGTAGYRGDWHGFRQYFCQVGGRASSDLCVWFEPDLLPGYVWSFPVSHGVANVGFGIRRNAGHKIQDMNKLWPDILKRPHIRAVLGPEAKPEGPHRALPIPAQLGSAAIVDRRIFFVGDAARASDPMSGEGIGQALETGRLAARALSSAGIDRPGLACSRYVDALSNGMIRDHRLAGLLSKILANPTGASGSLRAASVSPWARRNFARWLFEDYPRAILLTPRRWERGLFHRPGAFESPL